MVVDTATKFRAVLCGQVPDKLDKLLHNWRKKVGEQLICQIELFAILSARWRFKELLVDRRSIWWVDNDAARYGLIKGLSPSLVMQCLIREFYVMDIAFPTFSWVERVPSSSNIADPPSRQDPLTVCGILGISEWEGIDVPDSLIESILSERLVL